MTAFVYGALLLGVGLFLAFFGARFYKIMFTIVGVVLGYNMGIWLASPHTGSFTLLGMMIGLVLAFVFGYIAFAFVRFGLFFLFASVAVFLIDFLLSLIGVNDRGLLLTIFVFVVAVAFGIFAMALRADAYLLVAISSLNGGFYVAMGILLMVVRSMASFGFRVEGVSGLVALVGLTAFLVTLVGGIYYQNKNIDLVVTDPQLNKTGV